MKTKTLLVIAALFAWISLGASRPATVELEPQSQDSSPQQAILVTGASSGIGRYTAELLAKEGYYVYAGARKDKDLRELDAIDNMEGIRLDVTVPAEIEAAVKTVQAGGRGLYGLINNAGVAVLAPLAELTAEDLAFQLDVNVVGPLLVTQAFLPLLLESKGRISTTGSISGTVTWPLGGAYTMSKHAIEAYTDTLAAELEAFGVQVSLVDPGNYQSRITANVRERMKARGYTTKGSMYEKQLDARLAKPADRTQYKQPDEVAAAFLHAMSAEAPKRRYMVVPNAGEAELTIGAAVRRMVQLNQDQPYTLSRDELIEMLDAELKAVAR